MVVSYINIRKMLSRFIFICLCLIVISILFLVINIIMSGYKEQKPPLVESGEFPFKLVYEINNEQFVIEDSVVCTYTGLDQTSLSFERPRTWDSTLKNEDKTKTLLYEEENVASILKPNRINDSIMIKLHYGSGEYYMGDPNVRDQIHGEPHICYYEEYKTDSKTTHIKSTKINEKDLEKYFGIKIVEFSFSQPIKNKFE